LTTANAECADDLKLLRDIGAEPAALRTSGAAAE